MALAAQAAAGDASVGFLGRRSPGKSTGVVTAFN
jgi:hypothetical protein